MVNISLSERGPTAGIACLGVDPSIVEQRWGCRWDLSKCSKAEGSSCVLSKVSELPGTVIVAQLGVLLPLPVAVSGLLKGFLIPSFNLL